MRYPATRMILGSTLFAALLGGCATTVDMGPGYYRYDSHLANAAAPATVTVYQEPAVVYREPAVVYRAPPVVYQEPTLGYYYHDHGQ